eukprot:TRINITY_DN66791_c5_g2_i1.p1 TRINITY_DN66791_c5_g2~~TRINITY_DN66791_c5_g2_i1.p1  ORF type:complete len:118 (+),score=7.70 TRINITY_DN66791_c5_g2_i1:196-549(+)
MVQGCAFAARQNAARPMYSAVEHGLLCTTFHAAPNPLFGISEGSSANYSTTAQRVVVIKQCQFSFCIAAPTIILHISLYHGVCCESYLVFWGEMIRTKIVGGHCRQCHRLFVIQVGA